MGTGPLRGPSTFCHKRELEPSRARVPTHTYSEATKACSLMVCRTSENLILVVRVCPW